MTKQSQKRLPRFARNDGQELLNNLDITLLVVLNNQFGALDKEVWAT